MIRIHSKYFKIVLGLFFIVLAIVYLYPILGIIVLSFKTKSNYFADPIGLPDIWAFGNYIKAFTKSNMLLNLMNSIIYSTLSSVFIAIFSIFIAYVIARQRVRYHKVLFLILTSTLILPPSLIPLYKIMSALKLTNTYYGMILYYTGIGIAFAVFVLTAFIKMIPKDLDEAAFMDGCGYFRYIFTVIIPMSRPSLATVIMLNSLFVWNDFVHPYLFTTKRGMRTLATGLYMFKGEFSNDITVLASAVVMMVIPITIFYILLQKQITEGLAAGAVKG